MWLGVVGIFVLLLCLTWLLRQVARPTVTLIEPLGSLITSWLPARYSGNERLVKQALTNLAGSDLANNSPLSYLLASWRDYKSGPASVLLEKTISPLGRQLIIEQDGKLLSVVIGLADDLTNYLPMMEQSKQPSRLTRQQKGEAHGFLTLFVASRSLGAAWQKETVREHRYLGSVVLEPKLTKPASWSDLASPRLLTALPANLAAELWQRLTDQTPEVIDQLDLATASPAEREELITNAQVLANQGANEAYQVVRALQLKYRCQVFSKLSTAEQLPADRLLELPR